RLRRMSDHVGIGIDGSNPLGFLAAIGTFAVLSRSFGVGQVSMSWVQGPGWMPFWCLPGQTDEGDFLEAVGQGLTSTTEFQLGANTNITLAPEEFRRFLVEASITATLEARSRLDILASYGCESVVNRNEQIEITRLCMITGQGHQDFLRTIQLLCEST